ncbi:hypothetical protein FACS1894151_11500 [Spirochaetia bacterium]|nr:hypothetical protein FACS1894151_11500 [Spirochaetia bacterium]
MAINISEENKKEFKGFLENSPEGDELKNVVKNLDINKKALFALYIFEMNCINDGKLRMPAFDYLAALFKGKTSLKEDEAITLLDNYINNIWDIEFIGTKAFVNQLIKIFPQGGSKDFVNALEKFYNALEIEPGKERTMPMKHYCDDVRQKIREYIKK